MERKGWACGMGCGIRRVYDAGRRVRLLLLFALQCIRYCLSSLPLPSVPAISHTNTPTLTGRTAPTPSTSATQETTPSPPPIGPSTNKRNSRNTAQTPRGTPPRKIEHLSTPCENRAGWMGWHASLGDWLCNRLHGGVGIVADPWHGGSCDVGVWWWWCGGDPDFCCAAGVQYGGVECGWGRRGRGQSCGSGSGIGGLDGGNGCEREEEGAREEGFTVRNSLIERDIPQKMPHEGSHGGNTSPLTVHPVYSTVQTVQCCQDTQFQMTRAINQSYSIHSLHSFSNTHQPTLPPSAAAPPSPNLNRRQAPHHRHHSQPAPTHPTCRPTHPSHITTGGSRAHVA